MDDEEIAKTVAEITRRMEALISDTSVPKNVRFAITEAKTRLGSNEGYTVRISSAIYSIDAISNDINLPPQARTAVWSILSMLESVKTSG